MTHGRPDPEAGFTLIELVAVLAVYGLVAVMSLHLLTGAMRSRERSEVTRSTALDVFAALAVLRRDLTDMVPASPADAGTTSLRIDEGSVSFVLTLADANGVHLVPVSWRHDVATARVIRSADGEETLRLDGIGALSVRVADGAGGWRSGAGWAPATFAELPQGFEITLETHDLGSLRMVAAR